MGVAALVLGAAQALANRYTINADGMSYLDAADAWASGDWSAAVNAYWSPMYSWLLGAATVLSRPESEIMAARAVNMFALVLAVLAAERMVTELASDNRAESRPMVAIAAGIIMLWVFLVLMGVTAITPDLLLAAFALLALALLLRASRERSPRAHVLLGAVLGAGYLAKASMFPVAVISLAIVALIGARRRTYRPAVLAAILFAGIAAPLVIALSVAKGRPTFGESGRINYAFYIGGVPAMAHWRGGPGDNGTPVQPTRQVWEAPAAFEFSSPVAGTYPPWYDPSYWYEGVSPRVDVGAHVRQLSAHVPLLAHLFWPAAAALTLVVVVGGRARLTLDALRSGWPAATVCAAALAMFALIYLEERYVGGFILALYLWILFSLEVGPRREWVLGVAMLLLVAKPGYELFRRAEHDVYSAALLLRGTSSEENGDWAIARALHRHGVTQGDRVALIGTGARAYWARLAGVRIVAEVPDREVLAFWEASPATRDSVLSAMANASGAAMVIADEAPPRFDASGWAPLGIKGKLIRALEPRDEVQSPVEEPAGGPRIESQPVTPERRP